MADVYKKHKSKLTSQEFYSHPTDTITKDGLPCFSVLELQMMKDQKEFKDQAWLTWLFETKLIEGGTVESFIRDTGIGNPLLYEAEAGGPKEEKVAPEAKCARVVAPPKSKLSENALDQLKAIRETILNAKPRTN